MQDFLLHLQQQIAVAGAGPFWLCAGAVLIAGLVCWYFAFRGFGRARLIENVPTSLIRSAAQGYVELIGHAELMDGPKIVAPLSSRECVWYSYKIEERRRVGREQRWQVVEQGRSEALFLLKDSTGYCIIDPDGADVMGTENKSWYSNNRNTFSALQSFSGLGAWVGSGNYRYTESRLYEYEPLYAIGHFQTVGRGNDGQSVKDEVRDLVSKWKHDSSKIQEFDTNKDGQIDMQEWEALRQAAHQAVLTRRAQEPEAPRANILKQPKDKRPFLLSTRDPDKMVFRYRWIGCSTIILGLLSSALALYAINLRLSL